MVFGIYSDCPSSVIKENIGNGFTTEFIVLAVMNIYILILKIKFLNRVKNKVA